MQYLKKIYKLDQSALKLSLTLLITKLLLVNKSHVLEQL